MRSVTVKCARTHRIDMPVSLPSSEGMTLPTALAAPVEDGLSDQSSPCLTAHMMFCDAPRPPRQSLPDGPSTVFCVAVVACTVVIRPSMIVNLS